MIELAMMLGADIYYDTDGRLNVTKGTTDYLYTYQGSEWIFSEDKSDYISYTASYDITKAINKIMVYGEGYEGIYNYAIITNDNPQSPVRISLVGVRQGESIETAMAYSTQKCIDYGKYYLKMKSIIDNMNRSQNDPRANLLKSLKPYLKPSRKDKVDQYIKLFSMGKAFEILNPLGGEKKNDV